MKENLDERQVANRNKIGNQCFMLLAYLLFADIGLTGFGIRWIPYPADIMIILCACLFVYLIRLIVAGSYTGPRVKKKKSAFWLTVIVAIAGAALVIILSSRNADQSADNSGTALFIISAVLIIVVLIITLVRKKQDHSDE